MASSLIQGNLTLAVGFCGACVITRSAHALALPQRQARSKTVTKNHQFLSYPRAYCDTRSGLINFILNLRQCQHRDLLKNVQNFIQKGDTLQKHRLYLGCRLNYGSVAQLVERRTVNPYAAGSSPASASKNFICRKAGFPMEEKSGLRGRQSSQYGREPRRPASLISLPLWVRFPPLQPIARMASEDVWF